ncbi:MAG: DUF7352 domain-containing protein [Acidiferrobacteraceae bacterium]
MWKTKADGNVVNCWVIWKYPLPVTGDFYLDLPANTEILSAQAQQDKPQMWVRRSPADPDARIIRRNFQIVATGEEVEHSRFEHWNHIDTFQLLDGELVFHLFEVLPLPGNAP